ncbi:MAG: bifunctional pyr operon transcriptional regulator/uracil phosphoribosyltransferase PyrR [Acaryochloridaceae cyanobacterium SU_2_1]|nr:bifunctional pyr operon transcriptional regulator/uracil phosphoribosyltransferase PyrR [Acaryochloridaceae cyanobacterium SU_2_1]NJM95036.1 bifunctional pyr operon transcriptional regulator/uracil phosphoribosyltransferase PyrR [Acaryochloridaceae cyanobacterium CSU_5_19]
MSANTVEILSAQDLRRTITRLASEVIERSRDLHQVVFLGIPTRGVPLAKALAQQIDILENRQVPVGSLDITFYRDDLSQITVPTPGKTQLPTDLSGKIVILVDDVIYSGRTIRAALNAVHDYGRPTLIQLLVLIDRGHRELPIHPDFIGKLLPTAREEQVNVYLQPTDQREGVVLVTRGNP